MRMRAKKKFKLCKQRVLTHTRANTRQQPTNAHTTRCLMCRLTLLDGTVDEALWDLLCVRKEERRVGGEKIQI